MERKTVFLTKCQQIDAVIELMQAALATGDDVSFELRGGLALLQGAVGDLRDNLEGVFTNSQ